MKYHSRHIIRYLIKFKLQQVIVILSAYCIQVYEEGGGGEEESP
jgi:hypothetical protein